MHVPYKLAYVSEKRMRLRNAVNQRTRLFPYQLQSILLLENLLENKLHAGK